MPDGARPSGKKVDESRCSLPNRLTMKQTYRNHKLRITAETLAAFKRARVKELIRRGRPIPTTLRPSEPSESDTAGQQPLTFEPGTEATR